MNIEDKIWIYPELSAEERREVDTYVEGRAGAQDLLRRAGALWQFLEAGRSLADEPPADEALAFLAVMDRVDVERMPPSLATALARLRARVEGDRDLEVRLEAFRRRKTELEGSSDLRAGLDRWVHRAESAQPWQPKARSPRPETPGAGRAGELTAAWSRGTVAVLAVAATYGLLFLVGILLQPGHERLAAFEDSELTLDGYEDVRGGARSDSLSGAPEMYVEALEELRSASQSTMGLFPRFDEDRLEAAAALLNDVLDLEPEESFLAGEARFLLAKTELARGNVGQARAHLARVAGEGGRHATRSAELLTALER